ncbi:hypothetical protein L6452_32786 [Arctium lappa]|uniref:Uncharacterized protein n=1 Tax=Arctium lappa TaxID=4217 RepID=A0ACB8Z5H5_ARCLA|nr:hypothetical protein L6452_32786 [Arctium lappa]
MKTSMAPPLTLNKYPSRKPFNATAYRGMIGSLLYLIASQPDIMYSTCLCARYQSLPTGEAEYVVAGSSCAQLVDLFTKPLDKTRFNFLISELGMLNLED